MTVRLYLAPAAGGKTAYLVAEALRRSRDLRATPRVVVPTRLQARSWRRRVAESGGALGVHVGTFEDLYREILYAAGEVVTRLSDPIQFRLLRTLVDSLPLEHYAPLREAPGFVQVVRDLVRELKAGGVLPEDLAEAARGMGGEPRLVELAQIYTAYQERLQREGWADFAGVGWMAAEALECDPAIGTEWPCLFVDGFDDLTTVQLRVLRHLAGRVGDLTITLTGAIDSRARDAVHKRFRRTQSRLEEALQISALPLLPAPGGVRSPHPVLAHLESTLFGPATSPQPSGGAIALVAAPDREGEVREALRWIKARIVRDGLRPSDIALICRSLESYRTFVFQTAEEFGLPVEVHAGLPLRSNPAVAALLDLVSLPHAHNNEGSFPWRMTVESWRSPYFDWGACAPPGEEPIAITPEDALALDLVARWGSVVGGEEQWEEVFDLLGASEPGRDRDEEGPRIPDHLPVGDAATALRERFHRFARRIAPPEGEHPCRLFVGWLEALIGDAEPPEDGSPRDLGLVRRILNGPEQLRERDWAALNALKDVLRGLVWAEEALACPPRTFRDFLDELVSAAGAATYRVPLPPGKDAVLVASVTQARGLPFRAVALVGLAEGEFPRALTEDPFLRDADRRRLQEICGLALDLSTDSAEAEYFYEAATRAREQHLLTRPRIADNGAPWQASPYWDELRRRVEVAPRRRTRRTYAEAAEAASWPDLLSGAAASGDAEVWTWARARQPRRCAEIEGAAELVALRADLRPDRTDHRTGDLQPWSEDLRRTYGPGHTWSASRLEGYRTCPFFFFVANVLGLEPRRAPTEGLDARQLGNLYHRILEELYRATGDAAEVEMLLSRLEEVATPILDAAPRVEQFRPTAWWEQSRAEILENVRRSVVALESLDAAFRPYAQELSFGIGETPALVLGEGEDRFRMRGYIDRVDRAADGSVRIVDYKTGGPSSYSHRAVAEGKKLQLPLYALAARDALDVAPIVEGFYWHVRQAEPSPFTLGNFRSDSGSGPQAAMELAAAHAWEAVQGIRNGYFVPHAPDGGCPAYCPAAGFCWHYDPPAWF